MLQDLQYLQVGLTYFSIWKIEWTSPVNLVKPVTNKNKNAKKTKKIHKM